jgi:hypothetical protein
VKRHAQIVLTDDFSIKHKWQGVVDDGEGPVDTNAPGKSRDVYRTEVEDNLRIFVNGQAIH